MKRRKFKPICIMGILNTTPDSFSDGGKYFNKRSALVHAMKMVRDGADIIDIGGESTRPGARDVSADEELSRVIPVITAISKRCDVVISVDTRKSEVAEEALRSGARIINDISGLKHDPAMAAVAARYGASVIVMHMKGTPKSMQKAPRYRDLIAEIKTGLRESLCVARTAGIETDKLIIDPGIGFGKTLNHNLEILNRLEEFKAFGLPLCVGVSRKSFIGNILGRPAADRLAGTIAACVVAVTKGADILRVHDVREAADAFEVTRRILNLRT
ncbi:MAG: dihydropteroate synthase [Candidatus Omnitrophica bacterium]|nr:dihydropteroate synthase [Candidatus Omnitrophota bacterium]